MGRTWVRIGHGRKERSGREGGVGQGEKSVGGGQYVEGAGPAASAMGSAHVPIGRLVVRYVDMKGRGILHFTGFPCSSSLASPFFLRILID